MNKRERMRKWLPKSTQVRRRYLSDREHRRIKWLVRENGESMADVARTMGINYSTVTGIVYGTKKPWRPTGAAVRGRIPIQAEEQP